MIYLSYRLEILLEVMKRSLKNNNLDNLNLTLDEILEVIVKHPKLLQRPILVYNNNAIIGRPPEDILRII